MKIRRNVMIAKASTSTMMRVNHRRDDFVFYLLRFFLKLREARQHYFEHAADFARRHHVDVEVVEDARMLRQALGKCAAPLHGVGQAIDCLLQDDVALLFAEHVETAKKWQPGIDQCRQLPREHHQRLRLDRFLSERGRCSCQSWAAPLPAAFAA